MMISQDTSDTSNEKKKKEQCADDAAPQEQLTQKAKATVKDQMLPTPLRHSCFRSRHVFLTLSGF